MEPVATIAGILAIIGAIFAICARNLMRGILGLCVVFLGIAILCWEMGAYYIAVAQVLVFLGGVVALLVLSFSASPAPIQHGGFVTGSLVALLALVTLLLSLPKISQNTQMDPSAFILLVSTLFGSHAFALHTALLLLLAGVLSSQYLLEESP